jgi:hypothetical protein
VLSDEGVFVALDIQYAKRMGRIILSSEACHICIIVFETYSL